MAVAAAGPGIVIRVRTRRNVRRRKCWVTRVALQASCHRPVGRLLVACMENGLHSRKGLPFVTLCLGYGSLKVLCLLYTVGMSDGGRVVGRQSRVRDRWSYPPLQDTAAGVRPGFPIVPPPRPRGDNRGCRTDRIYTLSSLPEGGWLLLRRLPPQDVPADVECTWQIAYARSLLRSAA